MFKKNSLMYNNVKLHAYFQLNCLCFKFRACTGFGWDQDGDTLAIINDKSGVIFLWSANNQKLSQVDSGFRYILLIELLE